MRLKMTLKMTLLTSALTALAVSGSVHSDHADQGFIGTARVIDAKPLYETVEVARPVRECWTERVSHGRKGHDSYTGTIAGGIIGGVVGNQFGKGQRRKVLTVAGTLLGASIGHDLTPRRRGRGHFDRVRHCEVVDQYEQEQQLVGYRVKYRYEGQTFYTRTTEHPGKHIRVRVNVNPVNEI